MAEEENDGGNNATAANKDGPQSFAEALKEADEKPKSLLWLISLVTFLFALGVYDFAAGVEDNGCSMTYMYEYPKYVPVRLPEAVAANFSKYGLYAYGEGQMVSELSRGRFDGVPVLFVPGNSGSHKQVRSLASVALRKALDDDYNYRFHFDYFAVDFNEEFGAVYGGTLDDQARFVALCVDHILGQYKGSSRKQAPDSVVLVGHSIGGMVAKSLFLRPGFDVKKVSTVITLATPHSPVIQMDFDLGSFYSAVDDYWNDNRAGKLKDVTFVSVGGGERDVQVRSGLTHSPHADVNVVTTASPGTWVSTDHRCIAWCKQLVLSVTRALFDAIDRGTNQISKIASYRRSVFNYHLVERSAGKRYKSKDMFLPKVKEFDKTGFWSDSLKRQFVFERQKVTEDSHIMIKIFDDQKHKDVVVDAVNVNADNWVFGCKATTVHKNTRLCETGDNLSDRTRILPSGGEVKRKTVSFDLHQLGKEKGYTHVVVLVPKGAEHVKVHVDVFNASEEPVVAGADLKRSFSVEPPRWITFWKTFPVVKKTSPQAVFYNISLKSLTEPWQAYDVSVTRLDGCADTDHFGLMRFVTPWADDEVYRLIGEDRTNVITAMLQTPRQPVEEGAEAPYFRNPEVQLYLSPSCQYKVEIGANLPKIWGQIVRFYAPLLLPFSLAACMLTLVQQIKLMQKDGECPSFLSTISARVTPISVVMPSKLLSALLSTAFLAKHVPVTDFVKLYEQGVDFGILPIMLFFVSIGLVSVVSFAAWMTVIFFGRAANKLLSRFVAANLTGGNEMLADAAISGVSNVPFVISAVLIALAGATCGTAALCLGTFVRFVHLFGLYKDYLKLLIKDPPVPADLEKRKKSALSALHFQFSLSLLSAFVTVANAPSLMAYARALPFDTGRLDPDPSLVVSLALSLSLGATWGDRSPRPNAKHYDKLSNALQLCCILIVLFGSVSFYRTNVFLAAAFATISLHQLMAPEMTEEEVRQVEEERRKAREKQEAKERAEVAEGEEVEEATEAVEDSQSHGTGDSKKDD